MSTITLACPKCGERNKIDDTFEQSVCRCSACGQMMKVPARAGKKPAKQAERPDAPGAQPEPAPAPAAEPTPPDPQPAAAPPKKKSKLVIILAGLVLVAGLVGLMVFALTGTGGGAVKKDVKELLGGFDPTVNPFTLENANFFGLPLSGKVAIAIDGSATSNDWFNLAKETIMTAAEKSSTDGAMRVVVWTEDEEPPAYPKGSPAPMSDGNRSKLQVFLDEVYPVGQAEPEPAVKAALSGGPDQLILVTSQKLARDQIALVEGTLAGNAGVRVDVMVFDDDLPRLKELADRFGGHYVSMPLSRLDEWYRAAR